MVFDYSDYFGRLFTFQLFAIIFALFTLIYGTIKFIKKKSYKSGKNIFFYCLLLIFVYFSSQYAIPKFFKHGIHLLSENETNKIVNTGVVNELDIHKGRSPYAYITIDGQEYYIFSTGDIKIGDTITFEYLPKSKVILSWSKS